MSDIHPYLGLTFPKDAPVKPGPTPGKGWGLFATRDIEPGEPIMTEPEPICLIPIHADKSIVDTEIEPTHTDKTVVYTEVERTCAAVIGDARRQMDCLYGADHPMCRSIYEMVQVNYFEVTLNNVTRWLGIYPLHSRMNNSCRPNCCIPGGEGFVLKSFASRKIKEGEELCFTYSDKSDESGWEDRRAFLRCDCLCPVCELDPQEREVSDNRRRKIRELNDLLANSVVEHLTNAGTTLELPLSDKVRLNLFVHKVRLYHEEGLLGFSLSNDLKCSLEQMIKSWDESADRAAFDEALAPGGWLETLHRALGPPFGPDGVNASLPEAIRIALEMYKFL